jgi:hypothetical protein
MQLKNLHREIHAAIRSGNTKKLSQLAAKTNDLGNDIVYSYTGTPLTEAIRTVDHFANTNSNCLKSVEILLSYSKTILNVNGEDSEGYTAVTYASINAYKNEKNLQALKLLLDNAGTNPNSLHLNCVSPLHAAVIHHKKGKYAEEAIKLLLSHPKIKITDQLAVRIPQLINNPEILKALEIARLRQTTAPFDDKNSAREPNKLISEIQRTATLPETPEAEDEKPEISAKLSRNKIILGVSSLPVVIPCLLFAIISGVEREKTWDFLGQATTPDIKMPIYGTLLIAAILLALSTYILLNCLFRPKPKTFDTKLTNSPEIYTI